MLCPSCKRYRLTSREKQFHGECTACHFEKRFNEGETSFADLDWVRWQRQQEEEEQRAFRNMGLLFFVGVPVGFIVLVTILSLIFE